MKTKFSTKIIYISVAIISLISLYAPLFFYRKIFTGSFSDISNDWSDFGSYYGGVVGPVLSFLSIVLLIVTIIIQEKALKQQIEDVDNSLEIIKENNIYLQKQINNSVQQRYELTFNENIKQRYMIFDTFKTGHKEGAQIFHDDIEHIIKSEYEKKYASIKTINVGNNIDILKYIGLFNYIVILAKSINENNQNADDRNHFFTLLRYSLTESELSLLIIAKGIKELSYPYEETINTILGEYKTITFEDLARASNHSLFEVASIKEIIKIRI